MEPNNKLRAERSATFWNMVYIAVVVNTFLMVTALWAFSRYYQ